MEKKWSFKVKNERILRALNVMEQEVHVEGGKGRKWKKRRRWMWKKRKMERMEEEEKECRRTSIVGINGRKRKNFGEVMGDGKNEKNERLKWQKKKKKEVVRRKKDEKKIEIKKVRKELLKISKNKEVGKSSGDEE